MKRANSRQRAGRVTPAADWNSTAALHLVISVLLSMSCATATLSQASSALPPAAWERIVDGAFENQGVARIERIGSQWALTVLCRGTHSTYLADTTFDLAGYENRFVQARYRYVDRTIPDPKCVKAPCPPVTERRIALDKVTPVDVTPEQAAQSVRECQLLTSTLLRP
jgi:hypothetical protein